MTRRRGASAVPVAMATALLLTGCGASPGGEVGKDFARMVTISSNRSVFLECRGTGSPTVVLVSGTGGAADEWSVVVDAADPAAALKPSASAVLPTVASFTRVCAYDRPGTTRTDDRLSPSAPVPQPTTAEAGAGDLQAVLTSAGEHGPYVLVGASWGAMITALYARTHPEQASGLVTVDGASVFLRDTLSPAQWSDWMGKIAATVDPAKGVEVPAYPSSVDEIRAAPALPRPLPATVLTSDHPWDLQVGDTGSTWPAWLAAQDRLAGELRARHITNTASGHGIAVEQPRLVADAVRTVVDPARG